MVNYDKNKRYIKYLCHFHFDQDFFECHEILEEQWKLELNNDYKKVWLGLIRLAVVLYHYRRGNIVGAKKLFRHVKEFAAHPSYSEMAGLDHKKFKEIVSLLDENINKDIPYKHFHLPIKNQTLFNQFMNQKERYDQYSSELINKHSTRDRSDVINERKKELEKRNKNR